MNKYLNKAIPYLKDVTQYAERAIKFLDNDYILCFLLIPFFKPICFQYVSFLQWLDTVFVIWKVTAAAICYLLLLSFVLLKSKIPKLVVLVIVFETVITLSTLINQGNLFRVLIDAVSITAYVSLLVLGFMYNRARILWIMSRLLGILMMINLLSILCFPSGIPADLYTNAENPLFFMVIDNGSAFFLIYCIVFFVIEGLCSRGTLDAPRIIMILCGLLSAVLSHSATAITAVALMIAACFFIFYTDYLKRLNPIIPFALYAVFSVFLITLQNNAVFGFILENVFHRSPTITGRSDLWETAIAMIMKQPMLGYGRGFHDYIPAWGGYYSSHNYLLEILLQGGIIAFVLFIILIVYAVRKSLYTGRDKMTSCMIWGLLSILIAALMEAEVHSVYIFGCITLCVLSPYLEDKWKKKERKRKKHVSKKLIKRDHSDIQRTKVSEKNDDNAGSADIS